MTTLASPRDNGKTAGGATTAAACDTAYAPVAPSGTRDELLPAEAIEAADRAPVQYRVYRRRWFGLAQLVLLNIVISWDWLSFAAVSTTSAAFFGVGEGAINWLSTAFLLAFVAASPVVLVTLNRGGPKPAIVAASLLVLAGNWLRYAGARAGGRFGVVMLGQIIVGFAQPFVLTAPTRYSDLWFTSRGRISATALASLANPLGGALGQLVAPFWAVAPVNIPSMVLYIAIIASVAAIPSFFIPARPPLPPCPSSTHEKVSLRRSLGLVSRSLDFWLVFVPFSVYVGFFNAFSGLINQIMRPHGYSEADAGITGAILILVGLLVSAITSPILDRHNLSLAAVKIQVPVIAAAYLAFVWAPQTRTLAAPIALAALLGAASFSLMPIALELVVELAHPASPEVTSVLCWTGGQALGAAFSLVMDAVKDGAEAAPPFGMRRALIFQAVVAVVVVPLPLCLGFWGGKARLKRVALDGARGVS
ncbi:MAG: hypothetical protein M1832_005145 [Thelocarpon impressellum]|nr:MAG: hypothetical protein M1832_005145 [Thelocarpon impressellum]